ncbi:transcription-repair coupling factor [Fimbriimonas ginsengisoli]|uniref:Transcription-repair-coupling factor n=1 Tax=Fimbriimonas ginsengisoli Gsoil 348 TaxID=661478 RepID=A0A068NUR3_FIMGI|nr:transcription-repair coupling factor [Fimbriimonas ginsengisoli]AIE87283.1 transcription-repair coupling factor [Fimbriimonas ginsengisoli Gsoil 348]
MRTAEWARRLADLPGLQDILADSTQASQWRSVAYEARPVLLAASYLKHPRKMLVVTANYERALAWQAKLQICGVSPDNISQLPSGQSQLFEDAAPEHIALSDRLGALRTLACDDPCIVLASPGAALERTLPKDVLLDAFVKIQPGDTINPAKFLKQLIALGYEHQEPVRLPGQFSQRGGIIDVYATGRDLPIRVELFGDEVESIRRFDPNNQRSVGKLNSLELSPSRETLFAGHDSGIADLILSTMEREASTLSDESAERLRELIAEDVEALSQGVYFDRLDLYRPILHPDSGCAIDLLGEEDLLVLDEPLELETVVTRAEDELAVALDARAERGEILRSPAVDFILPPEHLATHPKTLALSAMNAFPEWADLPRKIEVNALSLDSYRGRAEALALTLRNYQKQKFTLVFTTDQPNRAKTVLSQAEIFASAESEAFEASEIEGLETKSFPQTILAQGNLGGGFVLPDHKLAYISDAELFGVARLRLPQKRFMEGAPIATVLDLKPGDFVVHINFGIGIFRGLVNKTIEGVEKEFLYVEYQAPDKLFVPADQLDRIQKYLNPGDQQPKLNKLTGGEWQRTLGKAKEEAKAFARDLVKLYAQRKQVMRKPYGPDTPFQHEMESTFPWVETRSQMQAIRDAKNDMNEPFPMDRLVCGDVGFGKTEVAIRAAFKAVQAGRQVAILCPTTILSEQHYRSFLDRLGSFGSQIDIINRFTSTAEKKEILARIKSGKAEVVVGTHALLGQGIEFKDLGLVVIDEEQKFGVKQKEMLKNLRTQVDVLTLSATPIPRTLSMALMDIRQMSLINDPPPGRLPVRTFVRPYAGEVIREAILRELARGGQVFYVYNRVESIHHVEEKLRKLVPMARIGVGHGQMHEKELEPIMVGFIKGEIDVLLSTTIVESGIDIPNANTLIVEQSDRLGLAQLYQLRGRVGRSDRQAYGYFLYSGALDATIRAGLVDAQPNVPLPGKRKKLTVTEGALQRLQALQEFSNLGAGYSLAFRDLQIRGAGELLGAKQSGTMVSVGYELYTQLINEAVAMLKNTVDGTPVSPDDEVRDPLESLTPLPAFEVPVIALIPEAYIKDQAQRLYYYQRMMSSRDEATLGEVQAEVEDRYGHPPLQVGQAFAIMGQRLRARRLGFEKLDARQGRIAITFKDRSTVPPMVFSVLAKRNREAYVTREQYIWPYQGAPIPAIDRMMDEFESALQHVESSRASLRQ